MENDADGFLHAAVRQLQSARIPESLIEMRPCCWFPNNDCWVGGVVAATRRRSRFFSSTLHKNGRASRRLQLFVEERAQVVEVAAFRRGLKISPGIIATYQIGEKARCPTGYFLACITPEISTLANTRLHNESGFSHRRSLWDSVLIADARHIDCVSIELQCVTLGASGRMAVGRYSRKKVVSG